MKHLTTLISAFFFLVIGVSHVWALPACPSSGYFHNCYGTYVWDSGEKYVGDWKDDKRNGQGTNTYADGDKYVGDWQNDVMHGQGTYTYPGGDKYVGEFKDGLRNGQGTNTFANGDKYVGELQDDKRKGQGTYTYDNGSKEVGTFENDKLNGYAITYDSDGSINQEGIFKDDEFLYTEKRSKPVITPSANSELDKHKEFCEEIGFTPKTEGFGNCVLKLMDKD